MNTPNIFFSILLFREIRNYYAGVITSTATDLLAQLDCFGMGKWTL